jgi:hypothetical protein
MTSPIDNFRNEQTCGGCSADHGEWIRTPARGGLRLLRRQGRHDIVRRAVRRRRAFRARLDEARLQLPHEHRVLCERACQLPREASAPRGTLGQTAKAVRRAIDERVAFQNFLAGGSSPVATRQIPEAARRAAIVAAAPKPAYNPVHITLRSMHSSLLDFATLGV